jgi:general secretion pathway protein A
VSHFAHWWWALAGFAALGLALGAITWWWSERDGPRMAQAAPPAANAINPADIAAVAKARGAAAPWMASGASAPALATLAAASPSAIQATLATAYEGDPGALQVFDPNRDALDLYTKPEQAWRALAAYWTDKVPEGKVCDALAEQHLSCHMNGGGTTDLLSRLDRPVILKLIVGGRALRVVLLGLNAERARIEADGKQWVVPTDALDRMWRGEYGTLWFPPEGYLRPLRPGDTGPAARALATALVRLHPAPDPNLGQDYDPYTRLRLAEFQRSNDLPMSTSVGPETFMMLHRLNGLPEPRLALE